MCDESDLNSLTIPYIINFLMEPGSFYLALCGIDEYFCKLRSSNNFSPRCKVINDMLIERVRDAIILFCTCIYPADGQGCIYLLMNIDIDMGEGIA